MRLSSRHYLLTLGLVAGWWRWRPVGRVEVRGTSMLPTLEPGDRLMLLKGRRVRVGDVVAFADPRWPARKMVKRVAARAPHGLTVLGDNPGASTDSRSWGTLELSAVRGRAIYRYFPESRRGRI